MERDWERRFRLFSIGVRNRGWKSKTVRSQPFVFHSLVLYRRVKVNNRFWSSRNTSKKRACFSPDQNTSEKWFLILSFFTPYREQPKAVHYKTSSSPGDSQKWIVLDHDLFDQPVHYKRGEKQTVFDQAETDVRNELVLHPAIRTSQHWFLAFDFDFTFLTIVVNGLRGLITWLYFGSIAWCLNRPYACTRVLWESFEKSRGGYIRLYA